MLNLPAPPSCWSTMKRGSRGAFGWPGMDGLALLNAIRGQAPRSKRIILSGCDAGAADGVADVVLHKPCPVDRLRLEVLGAG